MIRVATFLLFLGALDAAAQKPAAPGVTSEPADNQRIKWGLSEEQYRLVHPSRRPGGATYEYWKARTVRVMAGNGTVLYEIKRGPHANLLERIPGGPRRPVKIQAFPSWPWLSL